MKEWIFPVKLEDNYDGDTFKLAIDIGFALRHYAPVRLHGVDTPELRGGTDLTKAAAKLARDEAFRIINEADEVLFRSVVWSGKYGRPIGDIICDGEDLGTWLVQNMLALPYDGGSRKALQKQHRINSLALYEAGKLNPYI